MTSPAPRTSSARTSRASTSRAPRAAARRRRSARSTPKGLRVRLHPGGELAHDRRARARRPRARADRPGPARTRPWLLLECPFEGLDDEFDAAVERLTGLGYGLLIAHPERTFGSLERLRPHVEAGALLQVNVSSLLGDHGPRAREIAAALVRDGRAYCLASDAHPGTRERILPLADAALRRLGVSDVQAFRLTQSNPRFLLREGNPRLTLPTTEDRVNHRAEPLRSVPRHADEGPVDRGLQEIVDGLSLSLGRPVLIDDADLRPLAYSTQFGELDHVRTASILGRLAPDEARVALFAEGIRTAAGPGAHPGAAGDRHARAGLRPAGRRGPPARLPVAVRGAAGDAPRSCGSRAPRRPRRPRWSGPTPTPSSCAAATSRSSSPALLSADPGRVETRGGRARGRALPAAAAGARVGRRARRAGRRGVERRGARPSARPARGQAGAVRRRRRPAGVHRRRARDGRRGGDGGARRADRAARAGRPGRGGRRPARGRPRRTGARSPRCGSPRTRSPARELGRARRRARRHGAARLGAGRPAGRPAQAAGRRPVAGPHARGLPRPRGRREAHRRGAVPAPRRPLLPACAGSRRWRA